MSKRDDQDHPCAHRIYDVLDAIGRRPSAKGVTDDTFGKGAGQQRDRRVKSPPTRRESDEPREAGAVQERRDRRGDERDGDEKNREMVAHKLPSWISSSSIVP